MPSMTEAQEILFAGQRLLLDPQGAVFWPDEQCLILSDLHLEKGSFLAQFGSLLPRYDTTHTLKRAAELIERYRPEQVICLGDSFHDVKASARLEAEDKELLFTLIASVPQWHWVLGNHDPALAEELPGRRHAQIRLRDICLLHEPEPDAYPQIIGHYHPKLTLHLKGQRISGRSFLHDHRLLIMPAFGSYTGGLDAGHEAIASLLEQPKRYLIYRERLFKV